MPVVAGRLFIIRFIFQHWGNQKVSRSLGDHPSVVILLRRPSFPLYRKSLVAELHVAIVLAPIIS